MSKKRASKDSGGVNKSQAIRDALTSSPDASPKELAEQLNTQGISVTPAFVSMIKFKAKAGTGTTKKKKGKSNRNNQAKGFVTAENLIEAKKLVDRVGGIESAESLLGTLKKLR